MREIVMRVEAHVVDRVNGTWCDDCALPSAVDATILVADAKTLRSIGKATRYRMCDDCGAITKIS